MERQLGGTCRKKELKVRSLISPFLKLRPTPIFDCNFPLISVIYLFSGFLLVNRNYHLLKKFRIRSKGFEPILGFTEFVSKENPSNEIAMNTAVLFFMMILQTFNERVQLFT